MLASAYGLQYELPQDSMTGGSPVRGGLGQPGQGPVDFGQDNLLGSDLYVKEGMTEQYYKKVAALKSFANEVSSRYGFDVTRPNYRNRDSIRFHKSYLEALADIQKDQNELKRLATHENLSIQSPNVVMRTDEASGRDFAANIGENDTVKRLGAAAAAIRSEEEAEIFNTQLKPMLIEQLREEMNSSQDPREKHELQAALNQIEAIRPDVGISPAQQAQLDQTERLRDEQVRHNKAVEGIQRQRADQSGSGGGRSSQAELNAMGRLQTMLDINDPATLDASNLERLENASGTFIRVKGEKDSDKWVKVDRSNPEAWMRKLNGLINKSDSESMVSFDVLQRSGIDINSFSSALVDKIGSSEDIMPKMMTNFNSIAKLTEDDGKILNNIAAMIEYGGEIPDRVANKIGTSLSDKKIVSVESMPSGGFKSPRIKISVPNPKGTGTVTKIFSMRKEDDREILREILNHNADRIPRSLLEKVIPQGSGTEVASQQVSPASGISREELHEIM